MQNTGLNSKVLDIALDTLFEREEVELGEKETRYVGKRPYERRPYVWIEKDDTQTTKIALSNKILTDIFLADNSDAEQLVKEVLKKMEGSY